jgi:hypothetical protein
VLALAACGHASPSPSPAATKARSATPSSSASATKLATYPLGQAAQMSYGGEVWTVAALAYTDNPPTDYAQDLAGPGRHWTALKVRACLTSGTPLPFSSLAWSVSFSDDTSADFESANGYTRAVQPTYPEPGTGHPIAAGTCIAGWITLTATAGAKAVSVLYSLSEQDGTTLTATWTLGAS